MNNKLNALDDSEVDFFWGDVAADGGPSDLFDFAVMAPTVQSSGFQMSELLQEHYGGGGGGVQSSAKLFYPGSKPAFAPKEQPPLAPSVSAAAPLADSPMVAASAPAAPAAPAGVTLGFVGLPAQPLAAAAAHRPAAPKRARPASWGSDSDSEEDDAADNSHVAAATAAAVVRREVGRRAAAVAAAAVTTGEADEEDDDDADEADTYAVSDTERDLLQKRARNREHAKRSRMRKKVLLDGLEGELLRLRKDNLRLRQLVRGAMPDSAEQVLRECASAAPKSISSRSRARSSAWTSAPSPGAFVSGSFAFEASSASGSGGSGGEDVKPATSGDADAFGNFGARDGMGPIRAGVPSALQLMERGGARVAELLGASQQNLILTNPQLAGNPIVYASPGFLELTGYTRQQVVGRDWRLLTGPATDETSVNILSHNLEAGRDTSLCLLSYKADGSAFWNQLYMGALRNGSGVVVNYVGAICEVKSALPLEEFRRRLHKVPLPEKLLDDSEQDGGSYTAGVRGGHRRRASYRSTGAVGAGGSGDHVAAAVSAAADDDGEDHIRRGGERGRAGSMRGRTRASARSGGAAFYR